MCLSPEYLCQRWGGSGRIFLSGTSEWALGCLPQPSPLSDTRSSEQPTGKMEPFPRRVPQNAQFFLQPELSCAPSGKLGLENHRK